MKVFADLHHFELYYSFQLLFEKRLGFDLYRPIGLDWADSGYWALGNDKEFIECILSTTDGKCSEILNKYETLQDKNWAVFSLHLPRIGGILDCKTYYKIEDKSKDVWQKGITFEQFKNTDFDIIISSVPQHFDLFEQLKDRYQSRAKHIFHMGPGGCHWPIPSGAKNLMLHSSPLEEVDINHIYYHQEFDTNVFKYTPPKNEKVVRSYVHFPETETLWNNLNLDWDFKFIGKTLGKFSDMKVKTKDLAAEIQNSTFTLHIKPNGESYGHILHNSAACGRPLIINANDFEGKIGGLLLEDGITCLDISQGNVKDKLFRYSDPDKYNSMCKSIYQRFNEVVNFDEEQKEIENFLYRSK